MAVYVDDIAMDCPGQSLGEVLRSVSERLEPAGRIIVEVLVNGESVIGDELTRRQDETADDQDVRLTTAEPRELTLSTLRQVRQGLEAIRADQKEAAALFQKDDATEALKRVGGVLQSWLHIEEAVLHSAQLANIDLDTLDIDGTPVRDMTEQLLEQFRQFKDLLTNQDMVGLADALAYEWPQTVDAWDKLLAEMIRMIEGDTD